jgi:cell wall-associated NlpC family hydrolase
MGLQTSPEFSNETFYSPVVRTLIGIPYEECDCWKLCIRAYKDLFSIELKHYFDETPENLQVRKSLIYSNIGDFVPVERPEFGNLILFNIRGVDSHIGMYLWGNSFLHTTKGTGSVVGDLLKYNDLITGYYRLKEFRHD